ncbi:sensor histidine kinase [Paenibacillus sp. GCM10027626]|uniref:sensor histidine kinase n=1 Tax=Paenibacillus sp. GCM10027626 TaxID=3273411 RepID=UPI003634A9DD
MRFNVWLLAIVLIVVLLGVNNAFYYFTTKKSLEESLSHELLSVAKQIEISIELSRQGAEKFQEQIGRELRAAAIAAQNALDADVEKVTEHQLAEVSRKLDMLHITLLKRSHDDIELYKSSDPIESGLKTKNWRPWHQAFIQLFDTYNVSIDWGQRLKNFWSGPFEFAQSETNKVRKWGYYYDGTTNYIIDPYVSYESRQQPYDEQTGVSTLIDKTLRANHSLLEITVINPRTLPLGPLTTKNEKGAELKHITQQPIIFGTHQYVHDDEVGYVQEANETNLPVMLNAKINDAHVIKMFIPVDVDNSTNMLDENGEPISRYILALVADYKSIETILNKQFTHIALKMAGITALSIVFGYLIVTMWRKARDKLVRRTQETYVDEINSLFRSMREQRHDFLNHVQTIDALAAMNKIKELKAYTAELTGEIRQLNDIIHIGNPAIAALIRSKISQAESHKIKFETDIADLQRLALGVKTLDLTRLLGNLIDNAFDEVMKLEEERRVVQLIGRQHQTVIEFTVSNYCEHTAGLNEQDLFKPGFTTKAGNHSGLGLAIVKTIVDQYKGSIEVSFEEEEGIGIVTFVIRIPH